eukprot:scaffold3290_cov165-Ochromonas_danica.AAC.26
MSEIFRGLHELTLFLAVQQDLQAKHAWEIMQVSQQGWKQKEEEMIELFSRAEEESNSLKAAISGLQAELTDKSKEVSSLQEMVKEGARKCQAWEKAYDNIRSQLVAKQSAQSNFNSNKHIEGIAPFVNPPYPTTTAIIQESTYKSGLDYTSIPANKMQMSTSPNVDGNFQLFNILGQKRPAAPEYNSGERRLQLARLMTAHTNNADYSKPKELFQGKISGTFFTHR